MFGKTEEEKRLIQELKEAEAQEEHRKQLNRKFVFHQIPWGKSEQKDIDEMATKGFEPISISSYLDYNYILYKKSPV